MGTYCTNDSLAVVLVVTFRIGSCLSVSICILYVRANSCLDRLKAESGRNSASFHGWCMANTTIDREFFVVKIFWSARGATKIKRAKY